jgi:penicillin-insensitive murein endopeptidase
VLVVEPKAPSAPAPAEHAPQPKGEASNDPAIATTQPPATVEPTRFDPAASISIGHPSDGRLHGGAALPLTGPGFRFNDRRDSNARFATGEVINAIMRGAKAVLDALPPAELVVNDVSFEQGGPIDHHGSHRVGRDADILFYLTGDDGKPTPSVGAPIDPDGIGFDYKDLAIKEDDVRVHFDAPRTWRFVAALLAEQDAEVQRIFVVEHLRTMLLAEADRAHAVPELRARFADVTCQPSYPHDDHLHVRWFCAPEDIALGCRDLPPVYPWRQDRLAALGLKSIMGTIRRGKPTSKIVTHADEDHEVEKQRTKIHPDVHKFLERRKKWREQPHPGRKYCR